MSKPKVMTAASVPVADNQNSLTAGARGPVPVAYQPIAIKGE